MLLVLCAVLGRRYRTGAFLAGAAPCVHVGQIPVLFVWGHALYVGAPAGRTGQSHPARPSLLPDRTCPVRRYLGRAPGLGRNSARGRSVPRRGRHRNSVARLHLPTRPPPPISARQRPHHPRRHPDPLWLGHDAFSKIPPWRLIGLALPLRARYRGRGMDHHGRSHAHGHPHPLSPARMDAVPYDQPCPAPLPRRRRRHPVRPRPPKTRRRRPVADPAQASGRTLAWRRSLWPLSSPRGMGCLLPLRRGLGRPSRRLGNRPPAPSARPALSFPWACLLSTTSSARPAWWRDGPPFSCQVFGL